MPAFFISCFFICVYLILVLGQYRPATYGNIKMKRQTIKEAFNDANIADTRHWMLEDGLRTMFRAFAECDDSNRQIIIERFPFIAQAAKFYGLHSIACNTFENDSIEMPADQECLS